MATSVPDEWPPRPGQPGRTEPGLLLPLLGCLFSGVKAGATCTAGFKGFLLAEIRPFRGIRYNESRFPDLSPVLAPPYDVISAADYRALRERSDYNFVQLILRDPKAPTPPPEKQGPELYEEAAELLEQWIDDETLVQDRVPAVYLLDQTFTVNGETKTRRAFIAGLRVEEFGKGSVFPHEQTMPGPKADRLALMEATRVNMCQVFGLYRDEGAVAAVLEQMRDVDPIAEGVGYDGTKNTLRAVYHPKLLAQLGAAMAPQRIVVADGHHRYETAVAYRDMMRPHDRVPTFKEPYEFVATAFVSTSDPGLDIRATHRLISGIKQLKPETIFEAAAEDFEVEDAPMNAAAILSRMAQFAERHAFGVVTRSRAGILIRKMGRRDGDGSVQKLDTHILHHEIFAGLLQMTPDMWEKGGPTKYVQDAAECIEQVVSGKAQLAAFVNPTRMDEVEAIAFSGGKMPPKSTYFYPKMPSGTVINPLM